MTHKPTTRNRGEPHCGWAPNPRGTFEFLSTQPQPLFAAAGSRLIGKRDETVLLYEPLLRKHPTWRRGAQGIGDCVSWGWELAITTLMAVQASLGESLFAGEFATEPIYGGSRVEAAGARAGGYSDGSYGGAAAKWVKNYGALLRRDYSTATGSASHDLTKYDAKRARDWGNFGCGGARDGGKPDSVARGFPVKTVSLVTSFLKTQAGDYPQISTREAKTTVAVSNGDTLAIGGLIRDDEIREMAKIPLLGDLPIIGRLFRHSKKTRERTEIVILLSPTIVERETDGEMLSQSSTSQWFENRGIAKDTDPTF